MPKAGPNTARGKAISRRNASKHGIHSVAPVVQGIDEDPREWERHRLGMIDSLEPENHLEIVLVERLANILWRLKRLERYETEMIIAQLNRVPDVMASLALAGKALVGLSREQVITREAVDAQVTRRSIPDDETVTTITRYEVSLHRQFIQIFHELEAMQTRRKGGASPLARMDFSGPPGG
jgi:hypothetical protein